MTILYHYTSGQGLFGILSSSELHCSSIKQLNDPSEKKYFDIVLAAVIENSLECKEIYNSLFSYPFQNDLIEPKDQFIVSFSKNPNSLSMWNYYAKGNGYNIGLDIDPIVKRIDKTGIGINKIEMIYDKDEQINRLQQYILGFKDKSNKYRLLKESNSKKIESSLKIIDIIDEFNHGLFEHSLLFKHPAYKNEEEVRIIISDHELNNQITKYKVSENGVFIEYTTLKLKLKTELKSITTHPLSGDLHLESIKRFIISKIGENNVEISPSLIPFRIV